MPPNKNGLPIKEGAACKQSPTSNSNNPNSNTNKGSGKKIAAIKSGQFNDGSRVEQSQCHDFITVIRTPKACNKKVSRKSSNKRPNENRRAIDP